MLLIFLKLRKAVKYIILTKSKVKLFKNLFTLYNNKKLYNKFLNDF